MNLSGEQQPAGLAQEAIKYTLLSRDVFSFTHLQHLAHTNCPNRKEEGRWEACSRGGDQTARGLFSFKPNSAIKGTWAEVDPWLSWFDPSLLLHQSGCWKTRDAKRTYVRALSQIAMTTQTKQHKAAPTPHWILNAQVRNKPGWLALLRQMIWKGF